MNNELNLTETKSTNNKSYLFKCTRFQFESYFKACIIFIIVCMLVIFAIRILNFFTNNIHTYNSNTPVMPNVILLPWLIFMFCWLLSAYKEHFNHLLMMCATRKNIFKSFIIIVLTNAISLSILSIILQLYYIEISKISNFNTADILQFIYSNVNFLSSFLWTFAVILLIGAFALLYGALHYKIGKLFSVFFWVIFGCSWVIIPVITTYNLLPIFTTAYKMFFSVGNKNGIYFSAVNFIIAAIIFGCATYLIARRQKQKV